MTYTFSVALLLLLEGAFGKTYSNYDYDYNEYTSYNTRYGQQYYEANSLTDEEREVVGAIQVTFWILWAIMMCIGCGCCIRMKVRNGREKELIAEVNKSMCRKVAKIQEQQPPVVQQMMMMQAPIEGMQMGMPLQMPMGGMNMQYNNQ